MAPPTKVSQTPFDLIACMQWEQVDGRCVEKMEIMGKMEYEVCTDINCTTIVDTANHVFALRDAFCVNVRLPHIEDYPGVDSFSWLAWNESYTKTNEEILEVPKQPGTTLLTFSEWTDFEGTTACTTVFMQSPFTLTLGLKVHATSTGRKLVDSSEIVTKQMQFLVNDPINDINPNPSSVQHHLGAIIGGAVGGIVGLVILVILIYCCCFRGRKREVSDISECDREDKEFSHSSSV